MAFFGLTALGPQNTFAANSTIIRNIQIFSEEDFVYAWESINGNGKSNENNYCSRDKLEVIMKKLYHGPVPSTDKDCIFDAFDAHLGDENILSKLDYVSIMLKIREQAERQDHEAIGRPNPNCEYNSTSDFHLALRKNAAYKRNIQTKLTAPLTSSQEFGWEKQNLNQERKSKGGSDITKFQAELIKNGVYY